MGGRAAKTVTSQREILSDIPRWWLCNDCTVEDVCNSTSKYATLCNIHVFPVVPPWLETGHFERSMHIEDILWNVIEQIKVLIVWS